MEQSKLWQEPSGSRNPDWPAQRDLQLLGCREREGKEESVARTQTIFILSIPPPGAPSLGRPTGNVCPKSHSSDSPVLHFQSCSRINQGLELCAIGSKSLDLPGDAEQGIQGGIPLNNESHLPCPQCSGHLSLHLQGRATSWGTSSRGNRLQRENPGPRAQP